MVRGMTEVGAVASLEKRVWNGGSDSPRVSPGRNLARKLSRHLPKGSTLPDDVWAERHRWILVLLWLHVPALFAFSLVRHQTVAHSTVEMSVIAIFAFTATTLRPRRRLSTVITS